MKRCNELPMKLLEFVKKNKLILLLIAVGVILLLLPSSASKKEAKKETAQEAMSDETYALQTEAKLQELLSMIDGAGQVRVMLTLQTGCRTEYHTDTQKTVEQRGEDQQTSEERKTVILSEGSAYDKAAISAVEYPRFQGALILSEGAEKSAVKLNLIRAVTALTGLNSNQITVVKMK